VSLGLGIFIGCAVVVGVVVWIFRDFFKGMKTPWS
jgi:hypothetical protein